MKSLFIVIFISNFVIGIFFGSIGHLLSILIFPLIAVLHGYMITKSKLSILETYGSLLIAATCLLFGLGIGLVNASNVFLQSDEVEIVSTNLLSRAVNMGYFTTVIYFLLYIIIGLISYYFVNGFKSTSILMRNGKKEDGVGEI